MKKYWFPIVAIAFAMASHSLHAGASPTPDFKPKADVIDSVSATSISVKHSKIDQGTKPGGKGAKYEAITKTYAITKFTQVSIDGLTATVDKLQKGMKVTVHSEASGEATGDPTNGGTATEIIARTK